jgi:hypothetical protein
MSDDADPEIETSPLSGPFTRDGATVRVEIYRIADAGEGWSLEVIDSDNASTVWDERFATDQDAFREFQRTLQVEGIWTFLAAAPSSRH